MLMFKGLVRSLFQIGLFAAVLLIPAGTWQNPYAAPIVGDQTDRDQVVIDSGLYGRVRHPLYLGYILFLTGLGLWLGSVVSALVMPIIAAPIVARILIEEKTLRENLPGYAEYMTRVPYRLVPLAW